MSSERDTTAKTAVIFINWNGWKDTLETLESFDAVTGHDVRPIVVDNGSTDDSVAILRRERPDIELLETGENLGFASGNTIGIRHALKDEAVRWVLLLNTDVAVEPGFLGPLKDACRDSSVGAAGSKIFYFDPRDRLWAAGGRLRVRETVTAEFGRGELDGPRFDRAMDVSYLTTCCLMVPRDVLERVGLFDPLFFINVEDADWCRRASDCGYRLRYVPASVIYHKVAASTGGGYTPTKTFHAGRSNALWFKRHGGVLGMLGFVLANLVTLPAAWLRELPRKNTKAVLAKARGVLAGLRTELPAPPRL